MRTITAIFDNRSDAEAARDRLSGAALGVAGIDLRDGLGGHTGAHGHPDGRGGTHRGALGDYIDNRSGSRLMDGAGSPRSTLGDYLDNCGDKRLAEGAGSRRGSLGDFIDVQTGRRVGEGLGSKRSALGDFIDEPGKRVGDGLGSQRGPLGDFIDDRGKRLGEGLGSRRGPLGDFLDERGKRLGEGFGSPRGPLGDFIDARTGKRVGEGAGDHRGPLGDFIDPNNDERIDKGAGSERTAAGDYLGPGPGHVQGGADLLPQGSAASHGSDAAARRQNGPVTVLTARVAEPDIDRAAGILAATGGAKPDISVTSWRNEGWRQTPSTFAPGHNPQASAAETASSHDAIAAMPGTNDRVRVPA